MQHTTGQWLLTEAWHHVVAAAMYVPTTTDAKSCFLSRDWLHVGAQDCHNMYASCGAVFCHLSPNGNVSASWVAEFLQGVAAATTLVFVSGPKHLQLCTVSLLGGWLVSVLQIAAGDRRCALL